MDPLSISASISALLQLTGTVVKYLNAVKGASKEARNLLLEISGVSGLLYQLKDLAKDGASDESELRTFESLGVPQGPLEQFQTVLEKLASKLEPVAGLKATGRVLLWPFQKPEIQDLLSKIERLKTVFGLALQQDHM